MTLHDDLDWYESQAETDDYWVEKAKTDFAVKLETSMRRAGCSKAELARRINKSAAYITKVLRGDTNCTIETMVSLLRAVGSHFEIVATAQVTTSDAVPQQPLESQEPAFTPKTTTIPPLYSLNFDEEINRAVRDSSISLETLSMSDLTDSAIKNVPGPAANRIYASAKAEATIH